MLRALVAAEKNTSIVMGLRVEGIVRDLLLFFAFLVLSPVLVVLFVCKPSWRGHFFERLNRTSRESFDVWLHGASLGEIQALETFINLWRSSYPQDRLLLTCNTLTARSQAKKKYPFCHVQLAPLDWGPLVAWWARRWQPKIHLLSELDVWPARQAWLKNKNIPTVVLGVRLSEKGFKKTKKVWSFLREAYLSIDLWAARDDEVAGRLKSLGIQPDKIQVTGSLKYDALIENERVAVDWGSRLSSGPLLVAGSVHPTEENFLLEFVSRTQLILAPRHPQKISYFEKILEESKIPYTTWSSGQPLPKNGVLLVDQIGILAGLYQKADLAFVGGTLVPIGGHNVLEPAACSCPVVVGPHTNHVQKEMEILKSLGGGFQAQKIAPLIDQLLKTPQEMVEAGKLARQALETLGGGSKKSWDLVESVLRSR